MIIGNGDIAQVLEEGGVDHPDWVFFASGVSNSQETEDAAYERERQLLIKTLRTAWHLVYFSTLSVFYKDSRYTQHKKELEELVRNSSDNYTIVRLGNITWGDNPHTLINYLKAHPNAPIEDTYRYIIDKDEFLHWMDLIPVWSCEMNITGRRMKVADIVKQYGHA